MSARITKVHRDGTTKIYSTPSFDGTYLYFTSAGDNTETHEVGTGQKLSISNEDEDSTVIVECSFLEDVYLKDGFAFWENAVFGDEITLEIVLPANTPMISEDNKGNADYVDGEIKYITDTSVPDETWIGRYYLFPSDYTVNRFVNKINILGTNYKGLILESSDIALISKIFKFRFTYNNDNDTKNKNIKVSIVLELYREHTVGVI